MKSFHAQTYYELLEISVGASREEIRGAYERLVRLYADDQVVLYGLIEPAQAAALRDRLAEAREILSDDARRATYDASIGLPPREPSRPVPPSPPPSHEAPAIASPPSASNPTWADIAWVTRGASRPPPTAPQVLPLEALSGSVSGRQPSSAPRPLPPPPSPAVTARTPPGAPVLALATAPRLAATPPEQREARVNEEPAGAARPTPRDATGDEGRTTAPAATDAPLASMPAVAAASPPSRADGPLPPSPPSIVLEVPRDELAGERAAVRPPDGAEAGRPREMRAEPKVKPFDVGSGVEFNGDLLRQVRMARGMSLAQMAEKTRISARHLENVELDRYDALPAVVYLRGILVSIARELGLDAARVARSYLTFVEARRSKG